MLPCLPLMNRTRGLAEAAFVIALGAALTVVLTYPVAFHPGSLARINTDDGRWSIWVVAWVAHALTTHPLHVFDANIFYPHQRTLAYSEANIAAGVIGAPVWLASRNPYLTHNIVLLVSFVVSYAGAYYLVRYFTGNRLAAAIAGILFAFCPFIFARTAHIQLLLIGGLPFCMLAFHRLVDRHTLGRAIALGGLIPAQSLACAYYGIFAILMVGLGTVVFAITRRLWRSRDYWAGIIVAALTSTVLTLPFFLPYLQLRSETGFVRTLDDAREFSVNASAWLASSAWAHRWWLSLVGTPNEVLFPGLLTLALGIAGIWWWARRQTPALPRDVVVFYLAVAIIAFWSSFGPDAGLYGLLYKTIPIFSFLRAPGRIGILVVLSFMVIGAPVLAAFLARARQPALVAGALVVIAVADLVRAPLEQFRPVEPVSPVYKLLATLPYSSVIELPFWYERKDFPRHAYYMLESTAHWKPLINGYSDYLPDDFRNNVVELSSFPTRKGFEILAQPGTRYVVYHMDLFNPRSRVRLMERLNAYARYLRLLMQDGDVWLYEIVEWPNP